MQEAQPVLQDTQTVRKVKVAGGQIHVPLSNINGLAHVKQLKGLVLQVAHLELHI